jgi:hypothetical protein
MNNRKTTEVIVGIVICMILLAISAAIVKPILSSGIGNLPTYFDTECESSFYLLLFVAVAIMACLDLPERIRRSDYLRGQAALLAGAAFVIYVALRFFSHLPQIGAFTGFAVVGTVGGLGLICIIRVLRNVVLVKTIRDD